jgi:hypothetical protein
MATKIKRYVKNFNPKLCTPIKPRYYSITSTREALKIATRNLWLHFGIDTQKESKTKHYVGDFKMSGDFWLDYYDYHSKLFNYLRKRYKTDWSFWYLDYTPKLEDEKVWDTIDENYGVF